MKRVIQPNQGPQLKRRMAIKTLFVVYIVGLFYFLIFRHLGVSHDETWIEYIRQNTNLLPFFSVRILLSTPAGFPVIMWRLLRIFAGNSLLFISFGILASEALHILSVKRLAIIASIVSLLIELLQILSCTGTFDIEVVGFRVFGSLIGYYLLNRIRSVNGNGFIYRTKEGERE